MSEEEHAELLKVRGELSQTNNLFLEEITKNQIWAHAVDEIKRQNTSILKENQELRTLLADTEMKNSELEIRCSELGKDKERLIELNHIHSRDIMALRNSIEAYKKHIKHLEGPEPTVEPVKKGRKPLERKTWTRKQ